MRITKATTFVDGNPWKNWVFVRLDDGQIVVPNRPGLGTDLNWQELEKHPYQGSNFLPLFKPGWERREGDTQS